MKEHAAHALGFLLVGDEHFPHHKKLIDGLCEASKVISDGSFLISFKIIIIYQFNIAHIYMF